jgi:hypothetical protein
MKFSVSDFIKVTVAIATFMTASSPDAKAQSETEVLILGTAPLSQVDGFNQDANSHWSALIISKTNPSCFPVSLILSQIIVSHGTMSRALM